MREQAGSTRELTMTRAVVAGSLSCSIVLAAIGSFGMARFWTVAVVGLGVVTLAALRLATLLWRKGRSIKPFITLAVLNLLVVVPELALRAANFQYRSSIQFGYPGPKQLVYFDLDEKLFWKLQPATAGLHSLGFLGNDFAMPKPRGVYRVLYLGDSCTQQGYPAYVDVFLNGFLAGKGLRADSASLAESGYSSHQGRVLAEMYGEKVQPDAVVVFFGWNDHWLAYGAVDADKVIPDAAPKTGLRRAGALAHDNLRILQGLHKLLLSRADVRTAEGLVRVPPDTYRQNLLAIGRRFTEQRIPVVFLTAPTAMYRRGVPDYLVRDRFADRAEDVIARHRAYNQIVREVSAGSGALLLDLEPELDAFEDLDTLFVADGIHFTDAGSMLVAEKVARFIEVNLLARAAP